MLVALSVVMILCLNEIPVALLYYASSTVRKMLMPEMVIFLPHGCILQIIPLKNKQAVSETIDSGLLSWII